MRHSTKPSLSPELRAERKRVANLLARLLDGVLADRDAAPNGSRRQHLLGVLAGRVARVGKVHRDGGTVDDLEFLEVMLQTA